MVRGLAVVAAALATLAGVQVASTAGAGGSFFYGFTEDLPKEIGIAATQPARDLGASAFRVTLMWEPGQTQLTDSSIAQLDRATEAVTGMRFVLAVYANHGSKAPKDAAARDAYCSYIRGVLARYPSIRDVVIWNEPNKNLFWNGQADAAARYAELLARCYDVLHGAFPSVNVIGLALSSTGLDTTGSTSPGAFIRGVGETYRASGRTQPLFDTLGFHPYGADATERPWRKHIQSKTIAMGDWNKLMYNLWQAFGGTAQPIPGEGGVTIWYLEVGYQTAVDAGHEGAYLNTENVKTLPDYVGGEADSPAPSETTPAPDQHTQVLDSVRLAYCQPHVAAYFNFLLMDEPTLVGWQSGVFWADRTPKDSYGAFRTVIAEATSGGVNCDALKGGRPSSDFMPPSTPGSLQGEALRDPLRVTLTWSAAADDASSISYRIFRNGSHVGTTTATTWTNPSVASATTYSYNVRAIDSAGNLGDASASVSVTTPDVTPPAAPGSLTAQALASPARVELTWPASTDNVGVTAYELTRDGAVLGTVTGTAFTDSTVAGTTAYTYSVVAIDAAGNRSAAVSTQTTTPDLTPPSAPASLTATTSASSVQLSWTAATDDVGVVSHEVLRDGAVVATVTTTAWADTSVAQGGAYVYAVRALDAAGNRGEAVSVTVRVPDVTAPSAPSSVVATAYATRVDVTWGAATDNVGVTAYDVYRDGMLRATVTGTAYSDTSVSVGATYTYMVRARDAAGNVGPSASVSVTVRDATAPSTPTGVTAQALSYPPRVALRWNTSSDNVGVTGYRVFRNGVRVATVTTTSFTDGTVSKNTTYRYQVAAVDAAGNQSALSPSVYVKTAKR